MTPYPSFTIPRTLKIWKLWIVVIEQWIEYCYNPINKHMTPLLIRVSPSTELTFVWCVNQRYTLSLLRDGEFFIFWWGLCKYWPCRYCQMRNNAIKHEWRQVGVGSWSVSHPNQRSNAAVWVQTYKYISSASYATVHCFEPVMNCSLPRFTLWFKNDFSCLLTHPAGLVGVLTPKVNDKNY